MPSDLASKLQALGIGSIALAALYVCGFFVHLGESHLLGIDLPVASQLEYLVLGGDFLFQTLQALLRPLLAPGAAPWLSAVQLWRYLVVLLLLGALLGGARLLCRWPGPRRLLLRRLRALDLVVAIAFGVVWIAVLVEVFAYRDLLFPLRPEAVAEERGRFVKLMAPAELSATQIAVQRGRYQKQVLARELEARDDGVGPQLARRLRQWRAWQAVGAASKSLAFGLLILVTLGSSALLLLAWRGARTWPPLVRNVVSGLLVLLALFEACLLPLTYGIALKRRDFPVVRVSKSAVAELEGQTALFLGEAGGRVYLYQDDALWTLHVVASDAVEGWQIEGRKTAPAWIEALIELPAGGASR